MRVLWLRYLFGIAAFMICAALFPSSAWAEAVSEGAENAKIDMEKAREALEARLDAIDKEFEVLAAQRKEAAAAMRGAQQDLVELRKKPSSGDKELDAMRRRLKKLEAELVELRTKIREKEAALPKVQSVQQTQQDAVKTLGKLRVKSRDLLQERRRLERELKKLESTGDAPPES